MQRLWSDTRISLISSDSAFEKKLIETLPPTAEIARIAPQHLADSSPSNWQNALVLWDLRDLPAAVLSKFSLTNPQFTRNCSLLILTDSATTPGLEELLKDGAVDFLIRGTAGDELELRMRLARRPWVRALETAFEFLTALDVDLTMTEQKVFLCFLRSPDFTAGRKDIMDKVWSGSPVHPNTLDVHLFNIRRKLEPSGIRIAFVGSKASWTLSQLTRKRPDAIVDLELQPQPLSRGH